MKEGDGKRWKRGAVGRRGRRKREARKGRNRSEGKTVKKEE